ncbi:MAG: hypothetical protein ACK4N5_22605, partial [Myxococcales bacterium]
EDVARTFALRHGEELGLTGQTLEVGRVLNTKLGAVVRLQPMVEGLPIAGVEVTVALAPDNRIRRVQSDATPVHGLALERVLTGQQALDRAAEGVELVRTTAAGAAGEFREIAYVENGVAHRAYEVHLATVDLTRNLYAVVDAATGAVKSMSNRIYFADTAKVFDTNPGIEGTQAPVSVQLRGLAATRDPDGLLKGELLDAYNCCATENCDPSKGPKRVQVQTGQGTLDSVVCDFRQTASNVRDHLTGAPRTDYDYAVSAPAQHDPPSGAVGSHPGDSDTFAEVHVFHHANVAYDFFRTHGAADFVLRDAKRSPPRKTAVVANYLMPDYSTAVWGTPIMVNRLRRVDNAAFVPREAWQSLGTAGAGHYPDADGLVMFQGSKADFGYDGDVIYHELTHGVVYATANFQGLVIDKYGVLNEGGAMHEGFADYFA